MVASVIVVQSAPALGESANFSGGSFKLTPAAGGFVLGPVVNTSGQVVDNLHLHLSYTNLFGDRKAKVKNFTFKKINNGQSFKPKHIFDVILFYGTEGLPSLENPAYDATKTYWSNNGKRVNAP